MLCNNKIKEFLTKTHVEKQKHHHHSECVFVHDKSKNICFYLSWWCTQGRPNRNWFTSPPLTRQCKGLFCLDDFINEEDLSTVVKVWTKLLRCYLQLKKIHSTPQNGKVEISLTRLTLWILQPGLREMKFAIIYLFLLNNSMYKCLWPL